MCAERAGAVSDVRICAVENRTAEAALPCALSLWMGREAGVDVRADSDLVSLPHPDRHKRAGMASPADAASGGSVPTGEKLLYADRRFSTRAGVAEPATANRLGGPAHRLRAAAEPHPRRDFRQVSHAVLLDLLSKRMGHRHRISKRR